MQETGSVGTADTTISSHMLWRPDCKGAKARQFRAFAGTFG